MEYRITLANTPDGLDEANLERIQERLLEYDAGAMADLDDEHLRVSSFLHAGELMGALVGVGVAVSLRDIEQLPSICCGGCSG